MTLSLSVITTPDFDLFGEFLIFLSFVFFDFFIAM